MAKVRSKGTTPSSQTVEPSPEPPSNVIQLGSFRQRHSNVQVHSVFYLSEDASWLELLKSCPTLQVENIQNESTLKAKLLRHDPDLVLLESGIRWADPVATIKNLDYLLEVPIVMICNDQTGAKNPDLIKQAYSAGICDTLYAPLKQDELYETLEVLLKFQRHVSLHQ